MEAVLRLVPDGRLRSVEHLLGDLLPVVRRQAVEDDCAVAGEPDELLVDAEAGEVAEPPLALFLLPHARPDVRVEDIGAAGRLARIVEELDRAACLASDLDRGLRRLVALRRRRAE